MEAIATELQSIVSEERNKISNKKSIFYNFIFFAVVCSIFFITSHFILGIAMVHGTSMGNTIEQNSIIFYNRLAKSQPCDIIVAKHGKNLLIKRQIATGGQTVDIINGKVSVDGKFLAETYLSSPKTSERDVKFPYTVPEGHIFILGDNRATSVDSRNSQIGCIENNNIVGKVILIN